MALLGCRLLQPGEHYRRLGHDGFPGRQRLHSPPAQHAHQQGKLARFQPDLSGLCQKGKGKRGR